MTNMNRKSNSTNPYQGKFKKVLCVCSAGLLRSPTAAMVLSQEPYNFNTRAVGADKEFALIPLDEVLVGWADEIVCLNQDHADAVISIMLTYKLKKKIVVLDVPDSYAYRDPELVNAIKIKYDNAIKMEELLKCKTTE